MCDKVRDRAAYVGQLDSQVSELFVQSSEGDLECLWCDSSKFLNGVGRGNTNAEDILSFHNVEGLDRGRHLVQC